MLTSSTLMLRLGDERGHCTSIYYKLTRDDKAIKAPGSRGQPLDQTVEKYKRTELANLAELKSGDLVEIEMGIDRRMITST